MRLLQVQNPHGLFSNDLPFFVLDEEFQAESGNLISSGGTFDGSGSWSANLSDGMAEVNWDGEANFTIHDTAPMQAWRVSLGHSVSVDKEKEYSLCYKAKSEDSRYLTVTGDTGPPEDGLGGYKPLMGTAFVPEVGGPARDTGASLNGAYLEFHHRFVPTETDATARIAFNLAQSELDVQIDDVGLYEGKGCGTP